MYCKLKHSNQIYVTHKAFVYLVFETSLLRDIIIHNEKQCVPNQPIFIYLFLSFPGRVGFGPNPVEGESEPEELEDALMGNTTSTFFPANQTATTSFQVLIIYLFLLFIIYM